MRRVFVGVIALAVLAVVALGVSGTAPAQSKVTEVLIGSVLPLTGTFARLRPAVSCGRRRRRRTSSTTTTPTSRCRWAGQGFPGLGGVPSSSSCATIRAAARRRAIVEQLISVNKVHWINGEGTSGIASLIQPVVESAGADDCHACASPTLTEKGLKWSLRTAQRRTMVASVFSSYRSGAKKVDPTI